MQARRANSDRVTSARAAALSMLAMSSSENQNEMTRPMSAHIRTAVVGISTAAFALAACGSSYVVDTITHNPDGTCTHYRHEIDPASLDHEVTETVTCPENTTP